MKAGNRTEDGDAHFFHQIAQSGRYVYAQKVGFVQYLEYQNTAYWNSFVRGKSDLMELVDTQSKGTFGGK
jgi:hypothetical protein